MPNFSTAEQKYLKPQPVGRLATATKDGVPHVSALCYANDEDLIYVSTGYGSKKGRNIRKNKEVAFIVDEYLSWEEIRGVIVRGEAEFKMKGPLFKKGRDLIYAKYPKWEDDWPITEKKSHVMIIKPTKIISWGLT